MDLREFATVIEHDFALLCHILESMSESVIFKESAFREMHF